MLHMFHHPIRITAIFVAGLLTGKKVFEPKVIPGQKGEGEREREMAQMRADIEKLKPGQK